jgi:2-polyprenyl-3-methyl-5-hydroxy-6-metoxy-1,4-benzoquinol methylase
VDIDRGDGPDVERGCAGVDPLEAAVVRSGLQLVDAYERMGVAQSRKAFGRQLQAQSDRAHASLADLKPWDGARASMAVYQNDHNRLRFMRTLDFVRSGETVFDVGFGRGYLCGLLLRDRSVAAYHGIDVVPSFVDHVGAMLAANDLDGADVHVAAGDLYALDRNTLAATGATVVVCCEVLEHLKDPEKALRTLADALPDGTDLIFSVPLYGRLEAVWGHLTVFDVARLSRMCEAAGLYVHHVEPLANSWTFVVASRSSQPSLRVREVAGSARRQPSPRVREVAGSARPLATASSVNEYDFQPVLRSQFRRGRWVIRSDCKVIPASYGNVQCEAIGHDPAVSGHGDQYAGVAFDVQGLTTLRLRFKFPVAAPVEQVFVDLHSGDQRVGRWTWEPASMEVSKFRSYAFRLGQDTPPFAYRGRKQSEKPIDRVEVFVKITAGQRTSFRVGAAFLPETTRSF